MVRRHDEQRQFPARQTLLETNILIAGDYEVERGLLRGIQQGAVFHILPSEFVSPHHLMAAQKAGERSRDIRIEQYPHATAAGASREPFANANTACTCSALMDGNHSRNSSI